MKEFTCLILLVACCLGQNVPGGGSNMGSPVFGGMPPSAPNMQQGGQNGLQGGQNMPGGGSNIGSPNSGGMPTGAPNTQLGGQNMPQGGQNGLQGGQNIPGGGSNIGSPNSGGMPTGAPNTQLGGQNMPQGGQNGLQGGQNIPGGGSNIGSPNSGGMPTGAPNTQLGGQNMPQGGQNGQQGGQNGQQGGQNDENDNGGTGGTPSPIGGPQNVNRPCRRYDLQCIRYFFKDHSHCKKPYGKVPDPLYRAISNQFYPAFNLTVTNTNAYYTGFNRGRVEDLYVNRETDKVVLTIDFRDLRKYSKDVFIRYHRRAREPIITYGYSNVEFKSLLVTVTIPQVDDLRLDKADAFGYSNSLPVLEIDRRLGESSDPVVAQSFALLVTDLPTLATEQLLTESSYFAAVYIQNVICDFGLKLV